VASWHKASVKSIKRWRYRNGGISAAAPAASNNHGARQRNRAGVAYGAENARKRRHQRNISGSVMTWQQHQR